jgi:peptide/nickel transport system substrate-binding protein
MIMSGAKRYGISRRDLLKLTLGTAAVSAAGVLPPKARAEKRRGSLKMGHIGDITNFDCTKLAVANYPVFSQLYNVLLRLDETLKPHPELAESYEMARNGLSLTLKLRKGVKFHSGREFEAKDVAFTVGYYKDDATAANIQKLVRGIRTVDTPERYTAILRFENPFPFVFDALDNLFIVDKDTVADIKTKPAGTGPFMLASWDPGNVVTLRRFGGYWRKGYPLLDEIIVQAMPDIDAMQIAFESGALDMIEQPRYEAVQKLMANKDIRLVMPPVSNVISIVLNTTVRPFDDKRVRQAVNYAIDRQKIVDQYLAGIGEPWIEPYPSTSLAYDKRLANRYTFNLDKARELFAQAGYGSGLEFVHLMGPETASPGGVKIAQILQADLAKIGVKSKIETGEVAAVRPRLVKGDYQLASWQYGPAHKDPAVLFGGSISWSPTNGWHKFTGPKYAELVSKGERTVDPTKRKEIYRELTEFVLDESFTIPLVPRLNILAIRSYVRDFGWNTDAMEAFERTWLDK